MIKQSKHWLTGLLMAAMVLSLTGCASVSAPIGNNQSADSSSSATAVSHQRAQKKHADTKTSKASQFSSQTSQSASSSAAVATSSSLDGETVQLSDAAVQKAEPAQAAATVNDQVVDGLNQVAGLQPENGDQYMTSPTSDGSWQVDVRTNSGAGQDPNVSHLKGIYKYNPATGQYQQMDPMTGEFN